jgi:hypothetical protein
MIRRNVMKIFKVFFIFLLFLISSTQITHGKSFLERMKNSIEKRYNKIKNLIQSPFRSNKDKQKKNSTNTQISNEEIKEKTSKTTKSGDSLTYTDLKNQIENISSVLDDLYWAKNDTLVSLMENNFDEFLQDLTALINEKFSKKQFKKICFATELNNEYAIVHESQQQFLDMLEQCHATKKNVNKDIKELETLEKEMGNITKKIHSIHENIEKLLAFCEAL